LFPEEGRTLKNLHKKSLKRTRHIPLEPFQEAESLQHAKEHLFERSSVVREHELMTEALRHGRGKIDRRQLRGALELEQSQGSLIRAGNNLATRESLEREQRMIAAVDGGIGRYERLGRRREFSPSAQLRNEQQRAVHQILNSRDFAVNLRGAAGTGKTAALTEIARGLREAGVEVLAVAPTRGAVEELQKVGFRDAMTISRLLDDQKAQAALHGRVLVVDEAGMVSGRQMEGLLKLAQHEDARILFSGDTRQLQSVEASDALRILEQESKMKSVSLTAVQRQTQAQYRDAIQTLRHSPEQGLEKLEQLGAVREVPYLERAQAVASAYRALTSDSSRTVLVVAGTHEEIGKITEAIREDMKQRGELDRGIVSERYVPLQWTEAQKKDLVNYKSGQVLLFHRSSHGIEKHEALTVERTEKSGIVARDQHGMERTVSPSQARSFSVHERQQIEVAPGDRLLLTGNRNDPSFRATNGELVKVCDVDGGRVHLEDGRTLPANYHEFDHGYAVTAHRSQGKTVDAVILCADAMKRELFYVGASRGRQEIVVVTSDREQLRDLLGISTARPSATELAREQTQLHSAPMLNPARPPLQALEPSVLRKKDGHRHDLGMSR
jgi:ATP-dependent exoDNAse (exonuclease V) alpha subunit